MRKLAFWLAMWVGGGGGGDGPPARPQVFEYADEVAARFKEQLRTIEESRFAA